MKVKSIREIKHHQINRTGEMPTNDSVGNGWNYRYKLHRHLINLIYWPRGSSAHFTVVPFRHSWFWGWLGTEACCSCPAWWGKTTLRLQSLRRGHTQNSQYSIYWMNFVFSPWCSQNCINKTVIAWWSSEVCSFN